MTSENKPLIDLGNISNLAVYLKATEKQMLQAYGRALGRTATWLKTRSARMAGEGIKVRKLDTLRKRMGYYRRKAAAGDPDALKFWFGLNAMPVSDLKGKIAGKRGKRHARRDKKTGRFIKRRKGSAAPVFSPDGMSLPDTAFEDGYVTKGATGKRTILVRGNKRTKNKRTGKLHKRWVREAAIDIQEPMERDVISDLIREMPSYFMKQYEHEIKYRVATNLRTDGRGRRI